jgi:low affinity Fe/Cu permease
MTEHHNERNGRDGGLSEPFRRFAQAASQAVGSPWAFFAAVVIIVGWAVTGPMFHFSDTWQLVINTGTTIVTFLMVFVIQSTQNRDARAIHLKLDELIRAKQGARNQLVDLEHCTDAELAEIEAEFRRLKSKAARAKQVAGQSGNGAVEDELEEIEETVEDAEEAVRDVRRRA